MSKKRIYIFIGVFIAGQASIGMTNIINNTDVIAANTEVNFQKSDTNLVASTQYHGAAPKVEIVHFPNNEHDVKVTYKYEKKKNFTNIENNVTYMNHHEGFTGSNGNLQTTQPGKIAKVLSGKLLISSN